MPEALHLSEAHFQSLKKALADRYTFEEPVGGGGMGIVFRARDLKHEREVALKILPPDLAAAVGAERFLREIRIEAGLSHPHILPVYDSGEAAGLLYCVTPFIEGETLADRLERERQLPCTQALQIAREIADALAFAHAHHVIHRDVKPGNILLESGHAVLADFGLAKATSAADDESLTRTGFTVGTPAYSSPEQAAGDRADARTDLYSLGCVLYEMLAGQPPFQGPSSDSVVRQHMTATPTSVRILRPALPEGVEAILDKLLAKSPADRFSSAEELVRTLDAAISGEFPRGIARAKATRKGRRRYLIPAAAVVVIGGLLGFWTMTRMGRAGAAAAPALNPRDIAVLYFEDLSPDHSLGYVADGLTEGLIANLARVSGLTVVSRNGVEPLRGRSAPLDSVAEALHVGTLIRGSVEPMKDRLSVSIHLVEGVSGADFDRHTFLVPAKAYLEAQDSLVDAAARLLRKRLGEEVRLRRLQAGTSNVEAWAWEQRGERERKRAEALVGQGASGDYMDAFARADSFFTVAQSLDPKWVVPPTSRGWVAFRTSRLAPDLEAKLASIDSGMADAAEALALNPNDASALELRGTLRYFHWIQRVIPDEGESKKLLHDAQADLEQAVAIDPNRASAYLTLSHLYYQVSDVTSALMSAKRAYEADAFLATAPDVLWRLFSASYDTGRFTQTRWACNEGYRRFPDHYRFSECRLMDLTVPPDTPDVDEAWRLQRRTTELTPEAQRPYEEHKTEIDVAAVLAAAHEPDSARSVLLKARAGPDVDPTHELPLFEARVRTMLGDYDEAVELLRSLFAGFDEGGGGADANAWASHWWWNDLRTNPGFQRLLEPSR